MGAPNSGRLLAGMWFTPLTYSWHGQASLGQVSEAPLADRWLSRIEQVFIFSHRSPL
jgi:hypothetical protein